MATILRVRFTIGLQNGTNGLFQTYWRPGTSGGSNADATDCVARVRAALVTAQAAFNTGTVFIAQRQVDALEDSTGALTGSFTAAAVASVTGTSAGDFLPVNCAYLVRHQTALIVGRRRLQGRTFFPPPGESNNDSAGRPISVTAVDSAFNGMLTGGTTLSFPVIWARPVASPVPRAGTSGPITSSATETRFWGSQRDRRQ